MGLDMYLCANRYLSEHDVEERKIIDHVAAILPVGFLTPRIDNLRVEVLYWRKMNAIHGWFVNTVQEGVDDCGEYEVSKKALECLIKTINKIIRKRELAPTLLPSIGGFFFGNTEYDVVYWKELRRTVKVLTPVLKSSDYNDWWFTYRSGW